MTMTKHGETSLAQSIPVSGLAPTYRWDVPQPSRIYIGLGKRCLDIFLVLISLPLSLLLISLGAILLWCEGGQPFYRQYRVGQGGRRFFLLKLRTMVPDADAMLAQALADNPDLRAEWDTYQKLRRDPRVTPVGRVLRATSLDELPQLINVLKGDMSLIGPRPMLPDQLALHGETAAYLALRPGLSGLWQVSGRNESSFAERAHADWRYFNTVSLRMDIKLIFKTFGVVLRGTGC